MGRPSNDIGKQIGRELRGLYADVLSQSAPDRRLDLMDRIEIATIASPNGNQSPRQNIENPTDGAGSIGGTLKAGPPPAGFLLP
jgi:hypothetical protein